MSKNLSELTDNSASLYTSGFTYACARTSEKVISASYVTYIYIYITRTQFTSSRLTFTVLCSTITRSILWQFYTITCAGSSSSRSVFHWNNLNRVFTNFEYSNINSRKTSSDMLYYMSDDQWCHGKINEFLFAQSKSFRTNINFHKYHSSRIKCIEFRNIYLY